MKTLLLLFGGVLALAAISFLPRRQYREDYESFLHNDSAAGDYV